MRTIRRVHGVRLAHGYLDFEVETDAGPGRFTTRWTQSQAVDFGSDGKLLIDAEDNRWVVPRIADLRGDQVAGRAFDPAMLGTGLEMRGVRADTDERSLRATLRVERRRDLGAGAVARAGARGRWLERIGIATAVVAKPSEVARRE